MLSLMSMWTKIKPEKAISSHKSYRYQNNER